MEVQLFGSSGSRSLEWNIVKPSERLWKEECRFEKGCQRYFWSFYILFIFFMARIWPRFGNLASASKRRRFGGFTNSASGTSVKRPACTVESIHSWPLQCEALTLKVGGISGGFWKSKIYKIRINTPCYDQVCFEDSMMIILESRKSFTTNLYSVFKTTWHSALN